MLKWRCLPKCCKKNNSFREAGGITAILIRNDRASEEFRQSQRTRNIDLSRTDSCSVVHLGIFCGCDADVAATSRQMCRLVASFTKCCCHREAGQSLGKIIYKGNGSNNLLWTTLRVLFECKLETVLHSNLSAPIFLSTVSRTSIT